jgi:hypothetical protein
MGLEGWFFLGGRLFDVSLQLGEFLGGKFLRFGHRWLGQRELAYRPTGGIDHFHVACEGREFLGLLGGEYETHN